MLESGSNPGREVQLIGFALQHVPRAQMRNELGITENTLKTQIKGLLRKCGERSLDALAKNILRAALLEVSPGRAGHYCAPWASSPDSIHAA